LNEITSQFRQGLTLDIGSGYSILPTLLNKMGFRVISIDINKDALKWQNRNHVIGVLCSAEHLPFKKEIFAAVTAISSLEHIPFDGDKTAMKEIGRTLKVGGIGIIDVPFCGSNDEKKIEDPLFWHLVFVENLTRSLFQNDFQKIQSK